LVDLLDLGSREGDVVKPQIIHLSGAEELTAATREQVDGVIAKGVGVVALEVV
jgi:hypothetical protein